MFRTKVKCQNTLHGPPMLRFSCLSQLPALRLPEEPTKSLPNFLVAFVYAIKTSNDINNKIFSGYQPCRLVKNHRRFGDHLRPRCQGYVNCVRAVPLICIRDLITPAIFGKHYKLWRYSLRNFLHSPVTSLLSGASFLVSTLFSDILKSISYLKLRENIKFCTKQQLKL
jgi:hypothetical protein